MRCSQCVRCAYLNSWLHSASSAETAVPAVTRNLWGAFNKGGGGGMLAHKAVLRAAQRATAPSPNNLRLREAGEL